MSDKLENCFRRRIKLARYKLKMSPEACVRTSSPRADSNLRVGRIIYIRCRIAPWGIIKKRGAEYLIIAKERL